MPNLNSETGEIQVGTARIAYVVCRSRRRKRSIGLSIEPGGLLRITAPLKTSPSYIETVIRRRSGWIFGKLAAFETLQPAPAITDGSTMLYLGHACRLRLTQDCHAPQGCVLSRRQCVINIHGDADLHEEARLELTLCYKKRARILFRKRLDYWAGRLGVRYHRMIVSDPERLWGSCGADNTIRLNWRLMLAPLPLLDYVVAHELAHVGHKNHSKSFWNFLARVMPDHKARRKALNAMAPRLKLA